MKFALLDSTKKYVASAASCLLILILSMPFIREKMKKGDDGVRWEGGGGW